MKLETHYLWAWSFLSNDPFSFCMCFWRLQVSSPILPGRESLWRCLPFLPFTQCSLNWLQSSGQALSSLQSAMLKYSCWLLVKWNSVVLCELIYIATWEVNSQVTASGSCAGNCRALFRAQWDPWGRLAMKWILRKTKNDVMNFWKLCFEASGRVTQWARGL